MKPNFFIIGAPKCGTTALATYLNDHKDVFISNPKEPHFFADDFPHYKKAFPNIEKYESIFKEGFLKKTKRVGEASVWYLYSKIAVSNIKTYSPNSKIIIMLRNPIDLISSLHKQLLWSLDEEIESLTEALEAIEQRKIKQKLPNNCREPKFLLYDEIIDFVPQLENVYKHFSPNNIKIIFFDDFINDPLNTYKGVLTFLGIDYDGKTVFPKINERKKSRINFIAKLTNRPPAFLRHPILFVKKIFKIKKIGLIKKIIKLNSKPILNKEINRKLVKSFFKDIDSSIDKLSELTGRNLNHWKE